MRVIVRHQILAGKHGRQNTLQLIQGSTDKQPAITCNFLLVRQSQMEEFIYLYESMPYNIELMNRPLEDYLQKKQKIRITGGVFRGKEGCIMRLHRNTRLVFAFGNMTVAVSYLHAFPFEKIE